LIITILSNPIIQVYNGIWSATARVKSEFNGHSHFSQLACSKNLMQEQTDITYANVM